MISQHYTKHALTYVERLFLLWILQSWNLHQVCSDPICGWAFSCCIDLHVSLGRSSPSAGIMNNYMYLHLTYQEIFSRAGVPEDISTKSQNWIVFVSNCDNMRKTIDDMQFWTPRPKKHFKTVLHHRETNYLTLKNIYLFKFYVLPCKISYLDQLQYKNLTLIWEVLYLHLKLQFYAQ